MLLKKELITKLKELGLNSYEIKIWIALLSRGVSTAGELSEIANVPRSRSYDVLESLERKGFVIMKIGKPIKYIAVPPSEVIERVKKQIREEAERKINFIDSLHNTEILKELEVLYKNGIELINPSEISAAIKGRNNLQNHLETLIKYAEKEINIITTKDGLKRKLNLIKKYINNLKSKGVKIKFAAPIEKEDIDLIKELKDYVEFRKSDINSRLVIIDNKQVLFMLSNDDLDPYSDSAVWVNTEFFANTLKNFFESRWKEFKPLKQIL